MGVDILQGYGATEMGPVVSFTRPGRNVLGTVGEPIPGVEVEIAETGDPGPRPRALRRLLAERRATAAAIDADGGTTRAISEPSRPMACSRSVAARRTCLRCPMGRRCTPRTSRRSCATTSASRDAAVVGWPLGADLRVRAVLLLDDPSLEDAVVATANQRLAPHQQIRGATVAADPDLARTLKVRKPDILARLGELERPAPRRSPVRPSKVRREDVDAAVDPLTVVASVAGLDPSVVKTSGCRPISTWTPCGGSSCSGSSRRSSACSWTTTRSNEATVADLAALVEAARGAKAGVQAWRWPLSPVVRAIGLTAQVLLIYPFVHVFYRIRVTGLERIRPEDGPFLFTPNHCLHLDNGIILTRLPFGVRWKLSVAAAADTIYANPVQSVLASVLANAFPLAREGGVRKSLELLGARLDKGYNVLIYPEGKLTVGGPLQPFEAGAGLIAVEGRRRSSR